MKRSVQTVRRFAKTLLDVAAATDRAAAVRADRAELRRWLAEAPAFGVFAACARLGGAEARGRAVRELAGAAGLQTLTTEFLARVEAAGALERLGDILDECDRLERDRAGILRAEIATARPLDDARKADLARRLAAGRPLEISYREDPGLLGGFVARVGERVYDGSVAGRLARLRRRLADA